MKLVFQAVKMHNSYSWMALAFIGIGVMFSASLIESGLLHSFLKEKPLCLDRILARERS